MYGLLVALLLAIPMFNVYTSSLLSETNNELEKLKSNIEDQELTNRSLSMQIDELASLENIQKIWNFRALCREIIWYEEVKILAFFCKQSYNDYKVERSGGK